MTSEIHIIVDKSSNSNEYIPDEPARLLFSRSQILQSSQHIENEISQKLNNTQSSIVSNNTHSSTLDSIPNIQNRRASLPLGPDMKYKRRGSTNPHNNNQINFLSPTNLEYRSILNELVTTHNSNVISPKFLEPNYNLQNVNIVNNVSNYNNSVINNNVTYFSEKSPNPLLPIQQNLTDNSSNDTPKLSNHSENLVSPKSIIEEESSADTLLAAKIGQSLLEQNQQLMMENESLKSQIQQLQNNLNNTKNELENSVIKIESENNNTNEENETETVEELHAVIANLEQQIRDSEIIHLADTRRRIKQIKLNLIAEYEQKLQLLTPNSANDPNSATKSHRVEPVAKPVDIPPQPARTAKLTVSITNCTAELGNKQLLMTCFAKHQFSNKFEYIGQTDKQLVSATKTSDIQFKRTLTQSNLISNYQTQYRFTLFESKKVPNSSIEEKSQLAICLIDSVNLLWNNNYDKTKQEMELKEQKLNYSQREIQCRLETNDGKYLADLMISANITPILTANCYYENPLELKPSLSITTVDEPSTNFPSTNTNTNTTDSPSSTSRSEAPTPRVPTAHLTLAPPPEPIIIKNNVIAQNLTIELEHLRAQNIALNSQLEQLKQEKLLDLQRQMSLNFANTSPSSSTRFTVNRSIQQNEFNNNNLPNVDINQLLLEFEEKKLEINALKQEIQALRIENTRNLAEHSKLQSQLQEIEQKKNELAKSMELNKQEKEGEKDQVNHKIDSWNLKTTSKGNNLEGLYPLQTKLMKLCDLLSVDFAYSHLLIPASVESIFQNLFNLFQFQLDYALKWFFRTNLKIQPHLDAITLKQESPHSARQNVVEFELNLLQNSFSSYRYTVLQRSKWQPNSSRTSCTSCNTEFGVFKRVHHCRLCFQMFCYYCSCHWIDIGSMNLTDSQSSRPYLERVCIRCVNIARCGLTNPESTTSTNTVDS